MTEPNQTISIGNTQQTIFTIICQSIFLSTFIVPTGKIQNKKNLLTPVNTLDNENAKSFVM